MIFGTNFEYSKYWSDEMYEKVEWQEAEATRKDFNIVLIPSGHEILFLRALQGHSGRNPTGPFTPGQCVNSRQFLRGLFIILYVQSVYTPSQIQD